jgi:FAD/FMN-containing dehydrogenase
MHLATNLSRSVQPFSLSIWTHHLKSIKWFDSSFAPKGCRFTINGPAVTVASGMQWQDINPAAEAKGVSLVGGAFKSVSVGGFLSNGGHGAMSAKYGLGADMVLEIELINAAGEQITANECQNQDYFWAMRGVSCLNFLPEMTLLTIF